MGEGVAEEGRNNMTMFDPTKLQIDFPILKRQINGKRLVYLDNASTSQKPKSVIQAISSVYEQHNANIHRGIHTLSEEATDLYEFSRASVAGFIGAEPDEVIFTRNTTESINLVAYAWAVRNLKQGDKIVVSAMEHHSNLVPWQEVCATTGATMEVITLTPGFELDMGVARKLIDGKTKLVAITQMSNVLGTLVPVKELAELAHAVGAKILVDGAQSVPHLPVNVKELDCDWLAFSGHKMLGPTGVGVLFGKKEIMQQLPPFLLGGGMIREVDQFHTGYAPSPERFEAGTPNIADVIALTPALNYLNNLGMQQVQEHGQALYEYAYNILQSLGFVKIYGPQPGPTSGPVLSFNVGDIHPHDIASILDEHGVAIRAGHHCAQPLIERLSIPATARMSFYIYNIPADIDVAVEAIKQAYQKLK